MLFQSILNFLLDTFVNLYTAAGTIIDFLNTGFTVGGNTYSIGGILFGVGFVAFVFLIYINPLD